MTVKELRAALSECDDNAVVICMDENGRWDNVYTVETRAIVRIRFGGGNPFSDE